MEARQISYFLAVVDHGGFGRAAAVLEVAQPTLSQSIRALERELGAELFHRTARGLVLSPAGRAFVGPARALVRDLAGARTSVGQDPETTLLDLVATPPLAAYPGAALIGSFRARYPEILVRLDRPADDAALPGMVRDGLADLGLCYLPVVRGGLATRRLGEHELLLAFPPGAEPGPGPVPLRVLAGRGLIGVPAGGPRDFVEAALRRAEVGTRLVAELPQRDAVLELVRGGVGSAFLVAAAAARAGVPVRRLDPPLRWPYGLVHRAGPPSPAVAAFLDHAGG